jgi:hypothetical protein
MPDHIRSNMIKTNLGKNQLMTIDLQRTSPIVTLGFGMPDIDFGR